MKGTDVTEKQYRAAERFILSIGRVEPDSIDPNREVSISWNKFVRVVAWYGAIRCASGLEGGTVDEPGETYDVADRRESDTDRRKL